MIPQPSRRSRCVFCDEPALDGHLTCGAVDCDERDARERQLRIGAIVTVGRPCMGNPAGARALAVDEYDSGDGPAWFLLFPNGDHDGFPLRDLIAFNVQRVGFDASLAGYRFSSVMRLTEDWRSGVFDRVWS